MVSLKKMLAIMLVLGVTAAHSEDFQDEKFYTVTKMETKEIRGKSSNFRGSRAKAMSYSYDYDSYDSFRGYDYYSDPTDPTGGGPVGKVINTGKDLVALGEDVYRLVIKGKPSNTTSYAPIAVIPKVQGEAVDLLDTENWVAPVKRSFEISYKNAYGMNVVVFRYSVIYSYGGSYAGAGSYLTAVQIIPESVSTLYGFDFTATMKLGGIQNQGTKANPVAGATLLLEHTVSSFLKTHNQTDSFFVTGKGQFKKL